MARNTQLVLNQEAREKIKRGVNKVYDAVRQTLGPEGSNGLLFGTFGRSQRITNDGVTISECIQPKDPFEKLAADTIKETARKTNEKVGDGTTTTVVIAGKLLNEAFSKLSDGVIRGKGARGVMQIKKEILEAGRDVLERIPLASKKIETKEDLEKIATVSVEDKELGKIIADVSWQVGVDGYIDIVDGFKGGVETELTYGMRFPAKVPAHVFVNKPDRYEMVAEDCPVVVTNYSLDTIRQITFLNQEDFLKSAKIVILAPKFSEQVLLEFVKARQNNLWAFPVKVPSLRTEQFEDVSIYFGAKFIDKNSGRKLQDIKFTDAGFIEKLIVKEVELSEEALARGGKGEKVELGMRIETLKKQIEETKIDSHKKLLERRIASMASATGLIKVGAATDSEKIYKKKKIEDAVYACKAALQEGYVEGGGLCLKRIAEELPESLLTSALKAPYEQIQENAETEFEIKPEVIDPVKAVRLSVEHAISAVAHLITCKVIVAEEPEVDPGEGYKQIAEAINRYTISWARKEGLIKDSNLELEREAANMRQYEEAKETDDYGI